MNESQPLESLVLKDTLSDPQMQKIFDTVTEVNQRLRIAELSDDEVEEIVDDLNEQWKMFLGEEASLSGLATFADPEGCTDTGSYVYKKDSHNGLTVVLCEFGVDWMPERVNVGGEQVELKRRAIVLSLLREEDGDDPEEVESEFFSGFANIEEVDLSLYDMAAEQGIAHIAYFYPALAREINTIIESGGEREDNMTLALRELTIPAFDGDESATAFELYLNELMDYDEQLPYMCKVRGSIYESTPEDSDGYDEDAEWHEAGDYQPVRVQDSQLYFIHYLTYQVTDKKGVAGLHLVATQPDQDKNSDGHSYLIPVRSLRDFQSVRSAMYSLND